SLSLLQQAYNLGIPITFASDAHKPEQVSMFNDEVIKLARDVGYTECALFKKRVKEFIKF
ncbi:MAG: histidinol phosphate phosphatase, partial [Sulfurimonas sp.]|nr:histidinol phosphate phosphatase [Sulfurimonas sp.]